MNGENSFVYHDDDLIASYIQRLGSAASLALLHPACKVFSIPSVDGIIGYREELGCAIVLGDPLCMPKDIPELSKAFHDYCRQEQKKIIYVMTSLNFTDWALQNLCQSVLGFGDEIIIDPLYDTRSGTGPYPHLLRQKYKHATRNGVSVYEYLGYDPELETAMKTVSAGWVARRKGPQIYLLDIDVFADRARKRWFYAQQNGNIVGVMMLNRIDLCHGWALNGSLMLSADAPNSTSEFLMLRALEILREEECRHFSAGPNPRAQLSRIQGFGNVARWFTQHAYNIAGKIFKLGDRQRYWKKFYPRKEPIFIMFEKPGIGIREVLGLIRAYNVNI